MMATVRVDITFERTRQRLTGIWNPNPAEERAAWEMLVQLSTRVPVIQLRQNEGLLSEALTSLYNIFAETRLILARNGPAVAEDRRGELSFALIAGHLLNQTLRPVTAYWHPELELWLEQKPAAGSKAAHERDWPRDKEFRTLLGELRTPLMAFAGVFATACGADEFLRNQLDNEANLYEQFVRDAIHNAPPPSRDS